MKKHEKLPQTFQERNDSMAMKKSKRRMVSVQKMSEEEFAGLERLRRDSAARVRGKPKAAKKKERLYRFVYRLDCFSRDREFYAGFLACSDNEARQKVKREVKKAARRYPGAKGELVWLQHIRNVKI